MKSNSRLVRVLRVSALLHSGTRSTSGELSDALGVSRRTIFRDIALLRDSGVTVNFDEVTQRYWTIRNVEICPSSVNAVQLGALIAAVDGFCASLAKSEFMALAKVACASIVESQPETIRRYATQIAAAIRIIPDIEMLDSKAEQRLRILISGAVSGFGVRIRISAGRTCVQTLLSPYAVVMNHGEWIVVGRSSVHRNTIAVVVKSIELAEQTDYAFEPPKRFNPAKFVTSIDHSKVFGRAS